MKNRIIFLGDSYEIIRLDDSKNLFGNLDSYGIRFNEMPIDLGTISKYDRDIQKVFDSCISNGKDFENESKKYTFLSKKDILNIITDIGFCSIQTIPKWLSKFSNIDETLINYENAKLIFEKKLNLKTIETKSWFYKESNRFKYIESSNQEYYITDDNFSPITEMIKTNEEFKINNKNYMFKFGKLIEINYI